MSEIKVNVEIVNVVRHYAVIEGEQLKRLIADAVAKAAGLSLDDASVSIDRVFVRVEDRGASGFTPKAEVLLIEKRS